MAGKKGRSGPPGNLNSVKNPWLAWWSRKALRQQDRWILPFLARYMDEAIADAGSDGISSGRRRTLEVAQIARGASMLIFAELRQSGIIITTPEGWDLTPGFKDLPRFLSLEIQALKNVGLDRVLPPPKSLADYMAEIQEEPGTEQVMSGGNTGKDGDNGGADDEDKAQSA